jgi:flagellar FliJ protein
METPFRFGLERVRQVRTHAEDQAKEQFASSLSQRLRGEALLRAAEARLQDARGGAAPAQGMALSGADLVSRQAWVERLERSRSDAAVRLSGLDHQLETSRSSLTAASRRREVLDRLETRQREAHRLRYERRAGAELDEMALQMHARRSAA